MEGSRPPLRHAPSERPRKRQRGGEMAGERPRHRVSSNRDVFYTPPQHTCTGNTQNGDVGVLL